MELSQCCMNASSHRLIHTIDFLLGCLISCFYIIMFDLWRTGRFSRGRQQKSSRLTLVACDLDSHGNKKWLSIMSNNFSSRYSNDALNTPQPLFSKLRIEPFFTSLLTLVWPPLIQVFWSLSSTPVSVVRDSTRWGWYENKPKLLIFGGKWSASCSCSFQ